MHETKDKIVISIDCMGGDLGEQEVLKGIIEAYNQNNYLLHYFLPLQLILRKLVMNFVQTEKHIYLPLMLVLK